jgi:hypothetical protein
MQGGRAEVKPKMPHGRAKQCKAVEQKLNQKCKTAEQRNARRSSQAMQGCGAKVKPKKQDGRAKKCMVNRPSSVDA